MPAKREVGLHYIRVPALSFPEKLIIVFPCSYFPSAFSSSAFCYPSHTGSPSKVSPPYRRHIEQGHEACMHQWNRKICWRHPSCRTGFKLCARQGEIHWPSKLGLAWGWHPRLVQTQQPINSGSGETVARKRAEAPDGGGNKDDDDDDDDDDNYLLLLLLLLSSLSLLSLYVTHATFGVLRYVLLTLFALVLGSLFSKSLS